MKILVTGANGFIGKNLCLMLHERKHEVFAYDTNSSEQDLHRYVAQADFIVHLAGVNRPLTPQEFYDGNVNLTKHLVDVLTSSHRLIPLIYSSSIHAIEDNDYGKSKRMAEELLIDYAKKSDNPVYVYRLSNAFGKWCRPNYNSAISTFAHNIANGLEVNIKDPKIVVHLVYVDDIVNEFIDVIEAKKKLLSESINEVRPIYDCSLGEMIELLNSFKDMRHSLQAPSIKDPFERKLYATYLSYLPEDKFSYLLDMHIDDRGSFTEMIKTTDNGQISVNVGKPSIIKGNHYHNTKNEKFLVASGTCSIKFRKLGTEKIIEYVVSGDKLEVVDIPPGYTHSITNIGCTDSVTIMWANEPYDAKNPDTFFEEVIKVGKAKN
ncbi:MAG: NAD-dependent epimerase/dehydratase family protein [Bacilli bacterium]|jgi:UDP-2-acetamido-2,6-beta-L-arabino-hexul-4-ose reductase